jgi:hypothetical protein
MLQCYDATYKKKGHDIKAIIDDYEKLLVQEKLLKDTSGKSYLEVLQKIVSAQDFRITSPTFREYDPFFKVDNETKLTIFECEKEMIEVALKKKDSRWLKFSVNSESPGLKQNPGLMYQDIAESLTENDLNSYYFRLKMFQVFDMVNSQWAIVP